MGPNDVATHLELEIHIDDIYVYMTLHEDEIIRAPIDIPLMLNLLLVPRSLQWEDYELDEWTAHPSLFRNGPRSCKAIPQCLHSTFEGDLERWLPGGIECSSSSLIFQRVVTYDIL